MPLKDTLVINEEGVNVTNDRAIVVHDPSEIIARIMTDDQFRILCGRTPKSVVRTRPGKGKKTFKYAPHGYFVAVLNRACGFNWDWEILPQANGQMFLELPPTMGPDRYNEGEECQWRPGSIIVHGRLTVRFSDPENPTTVLVTATKTATGEKEIIRGMTWGGLIKSAGSDAFKKACTRMGIALDLYWQDADEDYIPPAAPPANKAEFIVRLGKELGITVQDALKMLGKAGLPDLEPAEDWVRLRKLVKEKKNG